MRPLDVVVAVNLQVGRSGDRRPCIVVELRGESDMVLAPCSSQFDMFDPTCHCELPDWHSDFAATGLLRSSYAIDDFVERPRSDVVRVLGRLEGELASRFLDWAGLAPPPPAR